MTIRKQAARCDHEIVGKLTRHAEWEQSKHERWYMDEAGNEYMTYRGALTIIKADGGVTWNDK